MSKDIRNLCCANSPWSQNGKQNKSFIFLSFVFCPCFVFRIGENASTIVCPVIDTIDWNSFEFYMQTDEPMIGGFDWRLTFQWHSVPEVERKRRKSRHDPIRWLLDTWLGLLTWSITLSEWHMTFYFHMHLFFQVSYHGRWAICCEQGLLWIPGHIRHGYGGVGRRKPGALLQGEFIAGHSSTYPLSNLRQWAVFKTQGKSD